ncbi:unnamed protein product, partial [Mesorhabditis spiculigera]
MTLIQRLPQEVVNRIAAGEVIVRPANAVKDDGCGIPYDSLPILCERFTTSKLQKFEDLRAMETFGFRGEALSSLSQVSKVFVRTKVQSEPLGVSASYIDGKLQEQSQCAALDGTIIDARQLFYNNSTRLLAFKNVAEETSKVVEVVQRFAILHPSVRFNLNHGKSLSTKGNGDRKAVIATLLGPEYAKDMVPLELSNAKLHYKLDALASNPISLVTAQSNPSKKKYFVLYVNNRIVHNDYFKRAIETVFADANMAYLFLYMDLQIEPFCIDVNVHSSKERVEFLNGDAIIDEVKEALRTRILHSTATQDTSNNLSQTVIRNFTVSLVEKGPPSASPSASETSLVASPLTTRPENHLRTDYKQQRLDHFRLEQLENQPTQLIEETVHEDDALSNRLAEQVAKLREAAMIGISTDFLDNFKASPFFTKLDVVQQLVLVGAIDCEYVLMHDAANRLVLLDFVTLTQELFYDIYIFGFGHLGSYEIQSPLDVRRLLSASSNDIDIDEAIEFFKAHECIMRRYFSVEFLVEEENLLLSKIPSLLDGYCPQLERIPEFLSDLLSIQFTEDGFDTGDAARCTAKFFTLKKEFCEDGKINTLLGAAAQFESYADVIRFLLLPRMKKQLIPPSHWAYDGAAPSPFRWVTSNSDIYKRMRLWVNFFLFLGLAVQSLAEDDKLRFDCHPEKDANKDNCEARGCIWSEHQSEDTFLPWCIQNRTAIGYRVTAQNGNTVSLQKNSGPKSPWDQDIATITMKTKDIDNVLNVWIGIEGRFEPQLDLPKETVPGSDSLFVTINNTTDPFSFTVNRKSNQRTLFDTSIGGLIFTDRFIQIATYLPSDRMYGWGENIHQTINHDLSRYLRWGMLARDEPPNSHGVDTKNLYGVHPFYMVLEPDGKAHGVLILNSNAQDLTTLPYPALIYRTIGGNLDMYFFPGPTPEDVTRQYYNFIGRPFLPAYWALGYQLCRYGYKSLDEAKSVIADVRAAGIPIDVAMFDIDYMNRYKDFTVGDNWSDLSSYTSVMHSWGMRLILIWDPAIQVDYEPYQRAIAAGAKFIEWDQKSQVQNQINDLYPLTKDTTTMLGVVWPDRHVAFPDFLDPTGKTLQWWRDEFKRFHDQVAFDGSWIDMNEPSVFGTNDQHPWYFDNPDHPDDPPLFCPTTGDDAYWENAPYLTQAAFNFDGGALWTKTLCMLARTANRTQRFYNTKNLYGWSEAKATIDALQGTTGQRGAVITRSTFPSIGRYAGHWLGDNTARWDDLKTSVVGAQEFNLFGIPYVGSDVCGFISATNEELCLRWQQMGSFHSFFRNHNDNGSPPQQPTVWPSVANATRKANLYRYQHLPYLFSLHFAASLRGTPVIRPVFFHYPTDEYAATLSHQFMWGPAIMVAPVTDPGITTQRVYLPSDTWYSIYDYKQNLRVASGYADCQAPTTYGVPAFIRGGYIVPRQTPDVTTEAARKNPFGLLVAVGANHTASGELFWDDGVSIVDDIRQANYYNFKFSFADLPTSGLLTIEAVAVAKNLPLPTLNEIIVLGYTNQPDLTKATLNGQPININVQTSGYSPLTQVLTIRTQGLIDLTKSTAFSLKWPVVKLGNELNNNKINNDHPHQELI